MFPGRTNDLYHKSGTMAAYFDHVNRAEFDVFGSPRFLPTSVRQFIMQRGDINFLDPAILGPALDSDYFVIFSGSYIKGPLLEILLEKSAVNIHAGVSPFYRGMACNFWACQQDRPDLVGSTIHLLSKGLDSGPILFHALPKAQPSGSFELGMNAVNAAHLGVVEHIKDGTLSDLEPVVQDKSLELKHSKGADFTDAVAREYLKDMAPANEIGKRLENRDNSMFIRPFIPA